jgi:hypothetical protein
LIEAAYREGARGELAVWCADEAGPYQAIPQGGESWEPQGQPARYPHEYIRGGTAKLLTLFHPASGRVRAKGVTHSTNAILHPWLEAELSNILGTLPPRAASAGVTDAAQQPMIWKRWQEGLTIRFTLPQALPPLRMLLVLDNLAGHKSAEWVCWLVAHGIMPLYTPIGGSWLNMAESLQRILVRRALSGQHPRCPGQIMAWLEAVARAWNATPTPFQWGGKRAVRRQRARARNHRLGGSGALAQRPLRHWRGVDNGYEQSE